MMIGPGGSLSVVPPTYLLSHPNFSFMGGWGCEKVLNLGYGKYFLIGDHNDWSRWFAISSPPTYLLSNPSFSFMGGVVKKVNKLNLDMKNIFCRFAY
jgi:hypothetical protein